MKFFSSDHHFFHKNCILYCERPFITIDEMNAVLLENINSTVNINDELYLLGDLGFGKVDSIITKIRCKNLFLIEGSHDSRIIKHFSHLFVKVTPQLNTSINGNPVVLNHCAMRQWDKKHYNGWMLYGHSHGGLKPPILNSVDVGVDAWGYFPVSEKQIEYYMHYQQKEIWSRFCYFDY